MRCNWLAAALAIAGALAAPGVALAQHDHDGDRGHSSRGHEHRPPPGGVFRGGGHFAHPGGAWATHPAWLGAGEFNHWRGGHWWHGTYEGRFGAWWIVGPDWYWYPNEVAAIPDPYTPPGMVPGFWYWCAAYRQYYPYAGACPSGWQPVAPL